MYEDQRAFRARARKGLLATLRVVAVASPFVFSTLDLATADAQLIRAKDGAPLPTFEVASVKPNNSGTGATHIRSNDARYSVENLPLREIIKIAYGTKSDAQITGGPDTILRNRYDIEARIDQVQFAQLKTMSPEDRHRQISLMLQALLADRFHLLVNFQTKELPVYALILAKGGPKFQPSATLSPAAVDESHPPSRPGDAQQKPGHHGLSMHSDSKRAEATAYEDRALDSLTGMLSAQPEAWDRPVVNKTGLSGKYDWSMHWEHENTEAVFAPGGSGAQLAVDTGASDPSLFTALEEQLGLKLKSQKDEVETIVIDHIEQPSEN